MSETFAMLSDYLKDFNSFYLLDEIGFCLRFMGEFYSRTARLRLAFCKEKKKENVLCLLIF